MYCPLADEEIELIYKMLKFFILRIGSINDYVDIYPVLIEEVIQDLLTFNLNKLIHGINCNTAYISSYSVFIYTVVCGLSYFKEAS